VRTYQRTSSTLMSIAYLYRCETVRTRSWWELHSWWQRRWPTWPRTRDVWGSWSGHSRRQSSRGRATEHGRHRMHWHRRHWRTREPSSWHDRWRRWCVGWSGTKRHRWWGGWHSTPAPSVRGLWGWLLARHIASATAAQPRNKGWDESTCGWRQSGRHH
jgi:hypothetical protein